MFNCVCLGNPISCGNIHAQRNGFRCSARNETSTSTGLAMPITMPSRRQSVRHSDGREILLPIIQSRSRPVLYQPIITFTKPIHHTARADEHNPCPSQRTPSPTKVDAQKQFCSDLPRDKSSSNQHVAS